MKQKTRSDVNNLYRRYTIILMLLVFLSCLMFYYEQNFSPPKNSNLNFETLLKSDNSFYQDPDTLIIQNKEDFDVVWNKMNSGVNPKPSTPEIDFSKKTVIAVFSGSKPSTGNSIEITSVKDYPDYIVISYRLSKPSGVVGLSITNPSHLITIEKTYKSIEFLEV